MRPTTEPGVAAGLGWLALGAATLALFYGLSMAALSSFLADAAARESRQLATGIRWEFDDPRELVGGSAFGEFDAFAYSETGVAGLSGDREGFLSLSIDDRRIDAALFTRLRARVWVDQPARWLLFHRPQIGGPILALAPVGLAPGWQVLDLDLAASAWSVVEGPGGPVSVWGGEQGRVADLRVHPASGAGTRFELDWVELLPGSPITERKALDWAEQDRASGTEIIALPWQLQRPETILAIRDRIQQRHPAISILLSFPTMGRWAELTNPLWNLGLAGVVLLIALVTATRRSDQAPGALALAGLCLGAAGLLTDPRGPLANGLLIAALGLLCGVTAWRLGGRIRLLGSAQAWRRSLTWLVLLSVPVPGLVWLAPEGVLHQPDPSRILGYLPWAALQQAILIGVLWGLCRGWFRDAGGAGVLAALLFGVAHFPNFSLMLATTSLGLLCLHLYRRSPGLLPLVILHAGLGTLYLEWATPWVFRSGMIGALFFG